MICNKCKEEKDIGEFPTRKGTKLGVRKTCKECTNKRMREYYKSNQEEITDYQRKWYCNHSDVVIPRKVYGNLKRRRQARLDCINHYSSGENCCDCCGEKHIEFLCIDHIDGGGNRERKKLKVYLPLYLKSHNYPEGYRILCHNCNMSIGFYGYCPHKVNK